MQMVVGLILDTKLTFKEHLENKINKCNRIKSSIKMLPMILPTTFPLTIRKAFVRHHLDYTDIIYVINTYIIMHIYVIAKV